MSLPFLPGNDNAFVSCIDANVWGDHVFTKILYSMHNKLNTRKSTIHFKKLTKGNNVFIVSVITYPVLQFLQQTFNVSLMLLDDAL